MPPYAPILMESTRSIGYSVEAAIADVIDNSIAAFAADTQVQPSVAKVCIGLLDDE